MNLGLVKKILNKLNGLHYRQEYLCFALESHTQPLHTYLVDDDRIIKDITYTHLFVGYNPVIFAFLKVPGIKFSETIQLIFSHKILYENDLFTKKDVLASMVMVCIKEQSAGTDIIFYYQGAYGKHTFIPGFPRFINSIYNQLFNKTAGNVFLPGNLYTQVQVAYAVPRIISLITVGDAGLYNLFPTDLHGQINEEHYIISLRIGGKACEQAEMIGKLLISQVNYMAYKTVYGLGKNHMQELRQANNFPFSDVSSEKYHLPLPEEVISYKELALADSFTHGIHRLLLFKIVSQQQVRAEDATLVHIHNSYASWRYKNNLAGNYLLR